MNYPSKFQPLCLLDETTNSIGCNLQKKLLRLYCCLYDRRFFRKDITLKKKNNLLKRRLSKTIYFIEAQFRSKMGAIVQ